MKGIILTQVSQLKIIQDLTTLDNQQLADEMNRVRQLIQEIKEGRLITAPKSQVGAAITVYARALNEEREVRLVNWYNRPDVQEELAKKEKEKEITN